MLRSDIYTNHQTGLNTLKMSVLDSNRCEKDEYLLPPNRCLSNYVTIREITAYNYDQLIS
jgi:hypothetical protein